MRPFIEKVKTFVNEKLPFLKTGQEFILKYWNRYQIYRQNRPPLSRIEKLWKYSGIVLLSIFIYFFSVDINFLWLFGSSPSLDKLQNPQTELASDLYTSDGVLLGKYYRENRSPVAYNKLSPNIIKALIATEDVRFYKHSGIDIKGMFAAAGDLLKGDGRGASTITQQLAKNLYKTRQKNSEGLLHYIPLIKTLVIKTKEWITAIKLERVYTKEEIITLYLNTVTFGSNTFGIKTAARAFFNTSPDSLNMQQSALLVGMLKAPTQYSPILNPKSALRRRNVVFSQLARYKIITKKAQDSLNILPIKLDYHVQSHLDGANNYFSSAINKFLDDWSEETGNDIYTGGYKIYTTIDSRMQKYAEQAVAEQVKFQQILFDSQWGKQYPWVDKNGVEPVGFIEGIAHRTDYYKSLKQKYKNHPDSAEILLNTPHKIKVFSWSGDKEVMMSVMDSIRYHKRFLHAGMMTMDPYTGQIKAWVGGIDYNYFKYDHVKQAKRQPGSTFKPFVYTAAIDNGWTPCDEIEDKMVTFRYEENGEKKEWTPKNADWVYSGRMMTLRHAIGRSINTVTAQLTDKIGAQKVADYAHKMGITSEIKPVPSVGLGSSDASVFEMVGAYSTFLNQGIWTEPQFISRIEDRYGNVVEQFSPKQRRVINPETAWLMLYMLKGGIEEPLGTSQNLWSFEVFGNGNEFAAKTGTSTNQADAWFMGITKDLVSGVWFGGDDPRVHFRTMLGEGSRTALPIYGTFMEKIYKDESLGITKGPLPKAPAYVKKKYYCPTLWRPSKIDSAASDSGGIVIPNMNEIKDSIGVGG